jgi:hypothetical protein
MMPIGVAGTPRSCAAPLTMGFDRAGDRTRTGDVQLGKLAFYQLNYARVIVTPAT